MQKKVKPIFSESFVNRVIIHLCRIVWKLAKTRKNESFLLELIQNEMNIYNDRQMKNYLLSFCKSKMANDVFLIESSSLAMRNSAIIMQGPLIAKDDLTIETVKLYAHLYPGTKVIISTWKDENKTLVRCLDNLDNCIVLLNDYPDFEGYFGHLNYQLVSTMEALKKAKELGYKFCLKTRCDQRFYKRGLIDWFVSLLKTFPVSENIDYQLARIIVSEGGANMFRPWLFTDQVCFGLTEDMIKYWNCSLDTLEYKETFRNAELVIVRDYLRRMEGKLPEMSLEKYWEVIRKQFITISKYEMECFWPKYAKTDYSYMVDLDSGRDRSEQNERTRMRPYVWDFPRWLALYSGVLTYDVKYEEYRILYDFEENNRND